MRRLSTQIMDYLNPNYAEIIAKRAARLEELRQDPVLLAACKKYYASHPWDFISDWGMTFDPRRVATGGLATMPFVLWEKQEDYIRYLYDKWKNGDRGLVAKSRDCGVTWLSVGFAVCMWAFIPGFMAGFGSRKEELVDKRGDDKSIFQKIRFFIDHLPPEFLPQGWNPIKHSAKMQITNPMTNAAIIGESGDNIGRGGRTSIYFVDEAAFLEQELGTDAALSQNTDCQIDISTPNGTGNEFYKKFERFNGTDTMFVFNWRDDPRKTQAWYDKQVAEQDPVTVAQEIDMDFQASAEDVFIPSIWVQSCIDAHKVLEFDPEGIRTTGFDPADVGDAKAVVNRWGSVVTEAIQKTDGDIADAVPWAMRLADDHRADVLAYDGDGMGAPVMKTALMHLAVDRRQVIAYHGSSSVVEPDLPYGDNKTNWDLAHHEDDFDSPDLRTNKEKFINYRAQTWTWVYDRIKATHDAVQKARNGRIAKFDPEQMLSISSECTNLYELTTELSRPKRIWSNNGRIQVESKLAMKKRQVSSPNLADALVIAFSVKKPPVKKHRKQIKVRRYRDPLRIR